MGDTESRMPSAPWGALLVGGIIAVILGLVIVFNPFDSIRFITVVVGIALIVYGIFGIIGAIRGKPAGWAGPVVGLIGGIVLVAWPAGSVTTLAIVIGIVWLAFGIVTVVSALGGPAENRWPIFFGGLIMAILGLIVVVWPGPSLALIAVLVGIAVLVSGIGLIVQAFRLRGATR